MFHSEVCLSPNKSALLLSSFWLILPLSDSFFIRFFSHLPLGFGGRRCLVFPVFFFSFSPCLSIFCIYLGIPDSSVYSHKSFVFFGRVSDTLVCLGNRLEGPSRTAARGIGVKGEAAQNVDEGKEVVKRGMLNGRDKTP